MRNLPVHWSEGLFVVPQHFQAADQHGQEQLSLSVAFDHAYHYGLRQVDLGTEAIANGFFHVYSCGARFRDGTLVSLEFGQSPDRKPLREGLTEVAALTAALEVSLQSEPLLMVYLAVPKLKLGDVNVALLAGAEGDGGGETASAHRRVCRYHEVQVSRPDETGGGDEQEVNLKALNVQLRLSTEDLANYELLPLARIKRAGQAGPELDTDYIPPVLAVETWGPLTKILLYIYDRIGQTIEVLSENVRARGINFADQDPAEVDRLIRLSYLCMSYGELGSLVFSRGIHPFTVYRELCRTVCRLSLLGLERRPPEFAALPPHELPVEELPSIPYYDHDRLGEIFRWFKAKIDRQLLVAGPKGRFEQRPFEGVFNGIQVGIKPDWLFPGGVWYVGVTHKNMSSQECNDFFAPNQLHWKMGSAGQVEVLFRSALPGLALKPMPQPPSPLPLRSDATYYEVSREPTAVWADVVASQTLALRFRDALIVNRESLRGKRVLILNCGGKNAQLEFSLFAVPVV
ncbi:MAG: type VI secretion system baseplate subunit TssK [Planctomycetota bacterium]|nr:type VI secretion system baseplate subunit TssK [Planctomycetota bacterium]